MIGNLELLFINWKLLVHFKSKRRSSECEARVSLQANGFRATRNFFLGSGLSQYLTN